MSDAENTPPTPKTAAIPPPSAPKTSAVPLKKETVRITLRARPGAGVTQPREATSPVGIPAPDVKRATAPIQLPSAPLPPPSAKASTSPVSLPPAPIPPPGRKTMQVSLADAAPQAPAAPSAPRPMAPSGGAPRPPVPGAPGAPRPAAPGAPRLETGAATQPLQSAPRPPMAAPRPPGGGSGTGPLAGGPTAALPKATQKLAATQPLTRPTIAPAPSSAPIKRNAAADSEQFYEDQDPDAGLVPLSALCLVLGVILLLVQISASDRLLLFTAAPDEQSTWKIPEYQSVQWETRDEETHRVTNSFKQHISSPAFEVPQ